MIAGYQIGLNVVQVLLQRNVKVYLGARSKLKAELAIQELKEQTGREAIFLELDLGNLASVRKTAEEYMRYTARTTEACIHF